jgi:hypothetical protein
MYAARLRQKWLRRIKSIGVALLLPLPPLPSFAASPPTITNVSLVNVTPSSFSVVWAASPGTSAVSVYADPGGVTNLAGQVGIEFYPLHTGDPSLTDAYDRRLNQAALRQKTISQGLVHVRVCKCNPGTTYYYRLQVTNSAGQAVWPATGPLSAATTAQENAFVLQSQQLILNLPGLDPSGLIVLLANSNTPSVLAAVAGDGAPSNQVYFSVSDLIAASGNTNYLPLGNQQFTAQVLGNSSNAASQTFSLNFTTGFLVGQENQFDLGSYAVLNIGSEILRAGDSGTVPIGLYASGITNLTFVLNLPTNRFSALTLQPISAQLSSASLHPLGSNSLQAAFVAIPGQTLEGNQEIAQLNFTASSNQPSAFVPLVPQSLHGVNADGSSANNFAVQSGRLVIIGNEPLVEATLSPSGVRSLALYGKPWASYEVQSTTNLVRPIAWSNFLRVPMTNLVQVFSGLDTNQAVVFYRAYEFMANPPLLEAKLANQNRSLLAYGVPGTNYVVQYSTNLSGVVAWYPLLNYTLTNSFQFITGIGNTNPIVFYRLKKP